MALRIGRHGAGLTGDDRERHSRLARNARLLRGSRRLERRSEAALLASVPMARALDRDGPPPTAHEAVAVSAFDAWLGKDRYRELDCDADGQWRRDERHNALCLALRERFEVFAIRRLGTWTARLSARRLLSDAAFLDYVDAHDRDRTGSEFFLLAIPALGIVYEQNWDDTNVAWFSHLEGLERFKVRVRAAGLHVIGFDC